MAKIPKSNAIQLMKLFCFSSVKREQPNENEASISVGSFGSHSNDDEDTEYKYNVLLAKGERKYEASNM